MNIRRESVHGSLVFKDGSVLGPTDGSKLGLVEYMPLGKNDEFDDGMNDG